MKDLMIKGVVLEFMEGFEELYITKANGKFYISDENYDDNSRYYNYFRDSLLAAMDFWFTRKLNELERVPINYVTRAGSVIDKHKIRLIDRTRPDGKEILYCMSPYSTVEMPLPINELIIGEDVFPDHTEEYLELKELYETFNSRIEEIKTIV